MLVRVLTWATVDASSRRQDALSWQKLLIPSDQCAVGIGHW